MLAGTRQLIKKRRFSAVLIADQGKCKRCTLRQRIAASLRMELSTLTKARMMMVKKIMQVL